MTLNMRMLRSRKALNSVAPLSLSVCLLAGTVLPAHADGHFGGDGVEDEETEAVNPEFDAEPPWAEDYFDNNPESGDDENMAPHCSVVDGENTCVLEDVSDTPDTPPDPSNSDIVNCDPVAPTAPTPDAGQAVTALAASLGVNPEERGLTGLETWLWASEPPGQVSWTQVGTPGLNAACAELPAPSTTFTATVDSWTFHIDGEHDSATYTSVTPGTEDDPAATHVFDYVDVYELELTADLRGAVNTRVAVDRRDYEVVEVRSRLTE